MQADYQTLFSFFSLTFTGQSEAITVKGIPKATGDAPGFPRFVIVCVITTAPSSLLAITRYLESSKQAFFGAGSLRSTTTWGRREVD